MQTDRQTDRQADRQSGMPGQCMQPDRQTDMTDHADRQTDRQTMQTDRQTMQTDRQTMQTDRQTMQTDRHNRPCRQTDHADRQTDRQTFFFSGSSLYFLDRILVRSRLVISGWILAYLARFSMKKRKYGVSGFLGNSGWVWEEGVNTEQ